MCGRFCLSADAAAIQEYFSLTNSSILKPRYNIAPGQVIPVIRSPGKLEFLSWGLRPSWLKADQNSFINARLETIREKPSFKQAFNKRRCLIIANGYYEWKQIGNRKQPYLIYLDSQQLFAFAGIWEQDGCAIITKPAKQSTITAIHERAPFIIEKANYNLWLDTKTNISNLQESQLEITSNFLVRPVSTQVNSTQHDSIECIKALQ